MRKRVSLGMTLNMGNYETIRVDVSAESDQLSGESEGNLKGRLEEEASKDLLDIIPRMKAAIESIR